MSSIPVRDSLFQISTMIFVSFFSEVSELFFSMHIFWYSLVPKRGNMNNKEGSTLERNQQEVLRSQSCLGQGIRHILFSFNSFSTFSDNFLKESCVDWANAFTYASQVRTVAALQVNPHHLFLRTGMMILNIRRRTVKSL